MLNKLHLRSKHLAIASLVGISLSATSNAELISFEAAYSQDERWPQFVTPHKTITLEDGTKLSSSIPVVFSRAYEDGKLLIVDRAGTIEIDHTNTNFIEQVSDLSSNPEQGNNFDNFIRQLGRRVFDLSHSQTKAVPEAVLSKFDSFLVCRTMMCPTALRTLQTELDSKSKWLAANNCRPIIVFKKSVPNAEFYSFLESNQIHLPVVVPIFTNGFLNFTFSERESNTDILWVNKNGKLLKKGSSLEKMLE